MSNMLVLVPRLCTTVPFVYIFSSHIAQGTNTSPTWLRSLFFICSFFTLHTHSKACILFCGAQLAWERANNNNKGKKKSLSKNLLSVPSPHSLSVSKRPNCSIHHFSFQHPHPPSLMLTPLRSAGTVLTDRLHCSWWGYGYLFVKGTLCSLFLWCQTTKLLIRRGSEGK